MIVWYNKHRQDSESSWFDSLEDKLAAIDDDSDNGIPISLYTKTQAYKFLEQLESVTSSFMSERYLNGCSKDNIQVYNIVIFDNETHDRNKNTDRQRNSR